MRTISMSKMAELYGSGKELIDKGRTTVRTYKGKMAIDWLYNKDAYEDGIVRITIDGKTALVNKDELQYILRSV